MVIPRPPAPTLRSPAEYFPALTGVRALAAYAVFIYHFNPVSRYYANVDSRGWLGEILFRLSYEMYLGVNVFYVLSGFLIYYRYADALARPASGWWAQYGRNRFARIYPVYLLILVLSYLWSYGQHGTLPDARTALATFTLTQAFFPDLVHAGIPQAWTLTIEETFYFSAPLIFWCTRRYTIVMPCLVFIAAAFVVSAAPVPGNLYHHQLGHLLGRTLLGTIVCFASGIYLAQVLRQKPDCLSAQRAPWFTYGSLAAALLLVLAASHLGQRVESDLASGEVGRGRDSQYSWFLLFVIFPAIVACGFWGLLTERSLVRWFLGTRVLVLLGGSSYCFYLIHVGVIQEMIFEYVSPLLPRHVAEPGGHSYLVLFVLLNLVAIAIFKCYEKPVERWIKNGGRQPSNVAQQGNGRLSTQPSRGLYLALAVILLLVQSWPAWLDGTGRIEFLKRLLDEDGLYETLEAILCLASMLLFALSARYAVKTPPRSRSWWPALLAGMLFLMLGEELSWGQRIFQFRTPETLARLNHQSEFSFHNLDVFQPSDQGNRLQQVWLLGMLAYLGLLPLLTRLSARCGRFFDSLGLPIASLPIAMLFLVSYGWYSCWPVSSEVLELVVDLLLVAFAAETLRSCAVTAAATIGGRQIAMVAIPTLLLAVVLWSQAGRASLPTAESQRLTHAAIEHLNQGHRAVALAELNQAIKLWPHNTDAHFRLALALRAEGKIDAAMTELREVVRLDPTDVAARHQLAGMLSDRGDGKSAIEQLRAALRVEPDSAVVAATLAWLLATNSDPALRNGAEAERLAIAACRTTNDHPLPLAALAAALAEQGRYSEAVSTEEKAYQAALAADDRAMADRSLARIRRYQNGQPTRESR